MEINVSLHINSVDELAVCHGLAVIHNMNYKTMRESYLQVCKDEVSKSYTISSLSFADDIINAIKEVGYRYIEIGDFGTICAYYVYWDDDIHSLPANRNGYYELEFGCIYKIA